MDKHSKLNPPAPTAETDICKCVDRPPLVLVSTLSFNPISCADCNLEVPLDQIDLTPELVEEIAAWKTFHDYFYNLWLDSREFEEWAKEQLMRSDSPVNKRGLILRDKIAINNECFYWWFVDNSAKDYTPYTNCPNCQDSLIKRENKYNADTNICIRCNIIIAN